MFFSAAAGTLLLSTVATVAGPLGAQSECSFRFAFEGTRLLNDGISNTAGPFDLALDAGTYTITVISYDDHDLQPEIGTQPEESFHIVLDSGYRSPATSDIPDDVNSVTTVFEGQVIEDSTTITLEHVGIDFGVNSVQPLEICFGEDGGDAPDDAAVEVCATSEVAEADADVATDEAAIEEVATEEAAATETCETEEVVEEAAPVCETTDTDTATDEAAIEEVATEEAAATETCETEEVVEEAAPEAAPVCETTDADTTTDEAAIEEVATDEAVDGCDIEEADEEAEEVVPVEVEVEVEVLDEVLEAPETAPDETEAPAPAEITPVTEAPAPAPAAPDVTEAPAPAPAPAPAEITPVTEAPAPAPVAEIVDTPAAPATTAEPIIEVEVEVAAPAVTAETPASAPETPAPAPVAEIVDTPPAPAVTPEAPVVIESIAVDPVAQPTTEPTTTVIETEVLGTTEIQGEPEQQLVPTTEAIIREAVAQAPAPDIETEVLGISVDAQIADAPITTAQVDSTSGTNGEVLALTGPSEAWKILVMMSIVMIAMGGLCIRWGRVA